MKRMVLLKTDLKSFFKMSYPKNKAKHSRVLNGTGGYVQILTGMRCF